MRISLLLIFIAIISLISGEHNKSQGSQKHGHHQSYSNQSNKSKKYEKSEDKQRLSGENNQQYKNQGNSADYPNSGTKGMIGYAQVGHTTGGKNGNVVYIKTLQQLQRNIGGKEPRILVIVNRITSPNKISVMMGSNKSIIGSWKQNIIDNVYFYSEGSNIIFQNIVFLHSPNNKGNGDTQVILEKGSRYWIDHCTFDGRKVETDDLGKLLKISAKVDYVSITNSKFMNHQYGLLFGYPQDNCKNCEEYNDYPRVTIAYNNFEHLTARAPGLMRFGKFHVYNNYITNCVNGFTIAYASKIYSEYNYFEGDHDVLDDKGDGAFIDKGSYDMAKTQVSHVVKNWHPSQDYQYELLNLDQTKSFCTKYSGAQQARISFGNLVQ